MPDGFVHRREHADAIVAGLVAVADRAQAHGMVLDARLQPVHFGHGVDHAGREQDETRAPFAAIPGSGDETRVVAAQARDAAGFDARAVALGLFAQAAEQFPAADAMREPRAVVAGGNPARAAHARVHHREAAMETREVGGRGQPGRPGADDEDIERRVSGPARHR